MAQKPKKQPRWAELDPKLRLEMFVLRARRICEHVLLREHRDLMQSLYTAEHKVVVHVDRNTLEVIGTQVKTSFPPEELMDSLAARVRPLLLESEPVYFPDVLNALGALVPDEIIAAAFQGRGLEWWRNKWDETAKKDGPAQAWHVEISDGIEVTDRMLANRWLYSDLVHADPLEPKYNEIAYEDRFRAGCEVMSRICAVIEPFLQLIDFLQSEKILSLPDAAFHARVVLSSVEREEEVVARMAPAGAPLAGDKSTWPVVNPAKWGIEISNPTAPSEN
ncbi:hypothetical protein JOJ87_005097 [Rhodococcus ruber]|uniref:hypothetical protein n=1 Tax=Rhodococcus ruber TaxID=1830 RepID=UPI001AE7AAF1|nr:hypothetical protein [Rhodococcus ruber]MBP2214685.1 hypothetical protein [Rhodococcus ruber]